MKVIYSSLILFFWASVLCSAQITQFDESVKKDLYNHVLILASDQMMGREAGGPGDVPASGYISAIFRKMELDAGLKNDYFQSFEFTDGASPGKYNSFIASDSKFKYEKDFYPLAYSATGQAKGMLMNVGFGISAEELNYDDYKSLSAEALRNKIFVIELSSPDGIHPHSKYIDYSGMGSKIETAVEKGASGIIFINSDTTLEDPSQKMGRDIVPYEIPIIFAKAEALDFIRNYKGSEVNIYADVDREKKTGKNVIAKIDNNASNWVVLGAHYDHLGFGMEGSLFRGAEKEVHNGADDNASGVALLLELSEHIKKKGPKKYNYLIIAFSGEEKGLLGSNHFVKNSTIDLQKVSFMINMDMVGRLDKDKPVLHINGVGTAKEWSALMEAVEHPNFDIVSTESGVGPSDHTSFYLQDIPVLHFFSGTHEDYHKPSDDIEKINFNGMIDIGNYILELITRSDASKQFEFVKTKDENIFKAPRFTVTLGVVPDYAFSGEGMRIDGVTDGKPASAAGLLKGDVVIKLGNFSVRDMTSYMEALSKFKAGEKTSVTYKRGEEIISGEIQF